MAALLAALPFAAGAALAAEPAGVAAKVQYERALEAKLDRLVQDVLGAGRGRVFVEATLDQSVTEETVERLAREAEAELLPGFPRPARAKRTAPEPEPVKRVVVRLVADPSVPAAELKAAERALKDLIDTGRGDEVLLAQAPIAETWRKTLRRPGVRVGLLAGAALLAVLAALVLFAVAAARRSAVQAVRQIRQEHARLASAAGPIIDAQPLLPGPDPKVVLAGVSARNLRLIARFLESRPAGASRWLLANLEPDMAAALFRLLPTAARQEAACEIAKGPPGPAAEAEVAKLCEDLHAFLEREQQGPGLLQDLLARSPDALRRTVLDSIKLKAPAALKQVTTGLLRFEDLERADPGSLALLARETTSEELGLALRGARASLQSRLLASLPAVLRESALRRARQKGPDEGEAMTARAAILGRWKDLEASGKVRPL